MSLVTAAIEKRARSCVQSASMRAVLPEPTGLATSAYRSDAALSRSSVAGKLHVVEQLEICLPSNAYRERPVCPVPILDDGHFATEKASWAIQDLVRVAMVCRSVRVRRVIVCVTVRHATSGGQSSWLCKSGSRAQQASVKLTMVG
jgi:hypothetical protein